MRMSKALGADMWVIVTCFAHHKCLGSSPADRLAWASGGDTVNHVGCLSFLSHGHWSNALQGWVPGTFSGRAVETYACCATLPLSAAVASSG